MILITSVNTVFRYYTSTFQVKHKYHRYTSPSTVLCYTHPFSNMRTVNSHVHTLNQFLFKYWKCLYIKLLYRYFCQIFIKHHYSITKFKLQTTAWHFFCWLLYIFFQLTIINHMKSEQWLPHLGKTLLELLQTHCKTSWSYFKIWKAFYYPQKSLTVCVLCFSSHIWHMAMGYQLIYFIWHLSLTGEK